MPDVPGRIIWFSSSPWFLIAAIMFSFNGLLFDPDIRTLETDSYIIAVMLGIATFFYPTWF